jgi:hypothetical protein
MRLSFTAGGSGNALNGLAIVGSIMRRARICMRPDL